MSKVIVQIQSSSTSLGQTLCGVKKQILMLLSSTVFHIYIFCVQKELSRSNSIWNKIINSNQYLRWLFNVIPSQFFQEICIKSKNIVSLCLSFAVIWCDLTWPFKSPKFSLHHLQNILMEFMMAVLTLKTGMEIELFP